MRNLNPGICSSSSTTRCCSEWPDWFSIRTGKPHNYTNRCGTMADGLLGFILLDMSTLDLGTARILSACTERC
ncbi:hypothetical protein I7I48_10046 [Histoplasma ohiense]|nr:hypothetical protein I7I48_10046 [Histoplasma ohiense (nom. inval.)]